MADPIKKISLNQIALGMHLEDVFDRHNVLLFSADLKIESPDQIQRLRDRGVQWVYINTTKGLDLPAIPVSAPATREAAYWAEIEKAKEVHKITLDTVRRTLRAIRSNGSFETHEVESAAQEIASSIERNPDALISLSQIKGYDEYTYVHSVNVGILVSSLAKELGYSSDDAIQMSMGGLLHDIGKMRIPESILNKPGKFVDWELTVMKKHPEHGLDILREEKRPVSDIARSIIGGHHERTNGSGYPGGLSGSQISEPSLIGAVADVYDALTTERVYRVAWTPQKALAHLFQGCDAEYSRTIVERFTKYLGIYPVGSFVKLVSGELGVVIRLNRGHLLAPTVLILFDEQEHRLKEPYEYNLEEKQAAHAGPGFVIEISLNPVPYRINIADYILPGIM